MAKIVILSAPAFGHLNPVLPVIAELVQRGHDVVVLNQAELAPLVERQGGRFIAYPEALSLADLPRAIASGNLIALFELLLDATDALLPFCLATLQSERPDVVVYDGMALWGEMAARRLGLRSVSTIPFFVFELFRHWVVWNELFGHARRFLPALPRLAMQRLRLARWRAFPWRSPLFPMRGTANILFTTRQLHPPSPIFDEHWHFVGPSIDPSSRPEKLPESGIDTLPIIYISLGTLHFSNERFLREAISTLAGPDRQLWVSIGRGSDPADFAPLPPNVTLAESFPQLGVLERAELFVTHGGLNSLHEALWFGVPTVIVPQQFEQLRNGLTVSRAGAGLLLDGECYGRPVGGAALRDAVAMVRATPAFRQRARELGAGLRQAGGYRQACDVIESVAR